jgi:hypothetical protein
LHVHGGIASDGKLMIEHDLARKPASIPDRVRDGLFGVMLCALRITRK